MTPRGRSSSGRPGPCLPTKRGCSSSKAPLAAASRCCSNSSTDVERFCAIGFELLPETFTLLELRRVHEAILGRPLNKDSFRRTMLDRGLVEATGQRATGLGHRPPELYRFVRPGSDGARLGRRPPTLVS